MKIFIYTIFIMSIIGCSSIKNNAALKQERKLIQNDHPREREKWEYDRIKDPKTGEVPTQNLVDVYNYYLSQEEDDQKIAISNVEWEERGPNNVGGRTRAIIFDLNDNTYKTVFAASVGGGLFKCTNIDATTPTWTKINDFFSNLVVNCIVQDPLRPDTIYFGTGEGYGGLNAGKGNGIWRSFDGGNNWAQITTFVPSYVFKMAINKNGKLYAATSTGLYESTDGGFNWTFNTTVGTGFIYDVDIAINGDLFYAKRTNPHTNIGTGTLGKYSIRNNTWSIITPSGVFERIEIACAPSDSNYVYLLTAGGYGSSCWDCISGFYTSTNGGSSWTSNPIPMIYDQQATATTRLDRGQGWYDLSLAIDPDTATIVYAGGVDIIKSKDAGATYKQISNWAPTPGSSGSGLSANQTVHADQHCLIFKPGDGNFALIGCDGGLYKSTNLKNTWPVLPTFKAINSGYNVTQYYSCAAANVVASNNFLAGAQDNGTSRFGVKGLNAVATVIGGDGGYCFIDQDNANNQLGSYVNSNYYKSTNGGGSFTNISVDNAGSFINPCDLDNTNNILYSYAGANTLARRSNVFGVLSKISFTVSGVGEITHVKVSPNNPKNVYIGTTAGHIYRINNADTITISTTPTQLSVTPFGGYISCIEIKKSATTKDDTIVVTVSNYNISTSVNYTKNGSTNNPFWYNLDDNNTLPNIPINWALFGPNGSELLLATDMGIYTCNNIYANNFSWGQSNTGLANVKVTMLKMRSADSLMVASTFGRGLYTSLKYSTPKPLFKSNITTTYISNSIQFTDESIQATSWQWDFDNNGSIDATTQNPTWAYGTSGYKTVKLIINGIYTKTLTDYIYILPNKGLPYTLAQGGNFETNNGDFQNYTKSGSSWGWGDSAYYYKDGDATRNHGWVTAINSLWYVNNSESYLYTPNFNFSKTAIDTLAFDLICVFEVGFDGFRVEYSTDLGNNWLPLGTLTANNWYNFANTVGNAVFPQNQAFFNAFTHPETRKKYSVSFLSGNSNVAFRFAFKSDASQASYGAMIDNFEITSTATSLAAYPIETTVCSKTELLGPNATVNFFSPNGKILATINNLTNHNYGLTTVAIDQSGTSAINFSTNNSNSRKICQKTYTVSPTTNNSNGQYSIKLYYSDAEYSGWKTATGQKLQFANIIKCPSSIASGTILNSVYGNSPTFGVYSESDSTISATFNTGFSGFAVGANNIVLPIELTEFNVRKENQDGQLIWTTASELNSDYFDIERSEDGINFKTISQVQAKGYSNSLTNYDYTDIDILNKTKSTIYYRLKLVDKNGEYKYSPIRTLSPEDTKNQNKLYIHANPFSDELTFTIESHTNESNYITIKNMEGKVLYSEQILSAIGKLNILIHTRDWAAGTYILTCLTETNSQSYKILKK